MALRPRPASPLVRSAVAAPAAVGIAGLAAWLSGVVAVFPSLGPTAYVMFADPNAPAAWPRSVVLGHGVALLAGELALLLTGLTATPSALDVGMSGARVAAIMLSLSGTAIGTWALDAPQPPAGATTLIVSLGLLHGPELPRMAATIVLFVVVAWCLARASGLSLPGWRGPR